MGTPRATLPLAKVLDVLMGAPSHRHYGLEIAREAGLSSGTTYPILARLERDGWLTSAWEQIDPVVEGRRPRRYYRLTGQGERAARDVLEQFGEVGRRGRVIRRRADPELGIT